MPQRGGLKHVGQSKSYQITEVPNHRPESRMSLNINEPQNMPERTGQG